jgi:hypothetical protein
LGVLPPDRDKCVFSYDLGADGSLWVPRNHHLAVVCSSVDSVRAADEMIGTGDWSNCCKRTMKPHIRRVENMTEKYPVQSTPGTRIKLSAYSSSSRVEWSQSILLYRAPLPPIWSTFLWK